ncbi:hypothetical protein N2152v2_003832 [Parachlorella kessleri]
MCLKGGTPSSSAGSPTAANQPRTCSTESAVSLSSSADDQATSRRCEELASAGIIVCRQEPTEQQCQQTSLLLDDLALYANAAQLRADREAKTRRTNMELLDQRARLWREERVVKQSAAAPVSAPAMTGESGDRSL